MDTFFKRKVLIILLTFLLFFFAEATVYLIIFEKFYAEAVFFELSLYILLLAPAFLFKSNKITIGYTTTILTLSLLLFAVNITLDYSSRDIFTFQYLNQVGEAAKIFDWDYINWLAILVFIGYGLLYLGGIHLIYKVLVKGKEEDTMKRYLPKGSILCLAFIILASITQVGSYSLIEKEYSESEIFGEMSGYQIVKYLSRYLKKTSMKKYGILNYSLATVQSPITTTAKEEVQVDNEDTNPIPVTDTYYGLLKDYNVIEIMIESGNSYLFDPYLTPNLYRVATNGIYFTNNYSKNKTNVSEFIGINGAALSNVQYYDGELPYSLPNVLRDYGYTSNYFHNNYGEFYNRNSEMVKLGFDNINFSLDINPDRQWYNNYNGNYPLDSETMGDILYDLAPVDSPTPYYSFYTTLSMHGPYTGQENWNKFIELGYVDKLHKAIEEGIWENPCLDDPIEVQNQVEMIMCETMDLDVAVGMLLDYLAASGQMEKTLLVMYGDHETYFSIGIDRPLKEYVYNCEDETYPGQYETMMFMYNPLLTKTYRKENEISTLSYAYYRDFTSPYIIVPTILELLGVDYNPELYTGVSIFQTTSPVDNVFYSNELCSLFTDKIYTIDVYGDALYQVDDIDSEYLEAFQKKVISLLEKIDRIENIYMNLD